tara:strand:- start:193 stop:585 length:393 start_codon:yes stop_codon:yes gene_type:complete
MSCFWNALLNTISNDDKKKYFNTFDLHLNPPNFIIILKQINKITQNVLWNNQELTKQQLIENKNAIDEYDKSTVNDGYFCSTFEPILFLLVEYLQITIIHDYNKNIITYTNKINNRYTINIYSNSNHCWN